MEKQKEFTKEDVINHFKASQKLEVVFEKKDGSLRTMICTNDHETIPQEHRVVKKADTGKPARKTPEGLFVVFDLEAGGWRSFTIAKVKSIVEVS